MSSSCPSRQELESLLADQLSESAERLIDGHVGRCPVCQQQLEELTHFPKLSAELGTVRDGDGEIRVVPGGALARLSQSSKAGVRFGLLENEDHDFHLGSLVRKLGKSWTLSGTGHFFVRQFWIWPLIVAALLGGIGWWVSRSVEEAIRQQRVSELTTVLNADVSALRLWMENQRATAELIAADKQLLTQTQELIAIANQVGDHHHNLATAPTQSAIRTRLAEPLRRGGFSGFVLVSPGGVALAVDRDPFVGAVLTDYCRNFFDRVCLGHAAVSKPLLSPIPRLNEHGTLQTGQPCMFTAAPIFSDDGKPIAAIGLQIRPEEQFTRILQVARPGRTGETYAFDRSGTLLSQSRFDRELIQVGLLADRPDSQSILNVEVRDPGVDMTTGRRPSARRSDQPLTRMAQLAAEGIDGHDVDGYRDYRGVPVIGAWQWLEEFDMGVATEMDVAEAFAPARRLWQTFAVLMSLLSAAAITILLGMILISRQKRQLHDVITAIRQFGQYTLGERIGSGAMGSVYKARHALLRRPTALKLLDPRRISEKAIARFEREVQLTSGLTHPNTVSIFDFGRTAEGVFYYAMEYLDGINLDDLVKQFGPLPQERAVFILKQICASLAEAHGLGMVHRDIKPLNIVLTVRGGQHDFVKVLDFGLARLTNSLESINLTSTDTFAGTPLFVSPEAVSNPQQVDARADVYAIGATAYYLLTGMPVFNGKSPGDLFLMHLSATPLPPSKRTANPICNELERLLLSCLKKSPDDRPTDAACLLQLFETCPIPDRWTPADAAQWWNERPTLQSVTAYTERPE